MKIGLLTYFWDNNAGQYWQAITTFRRLKEAFPSADVEIVNVRHGVSAHEGRMPRRVLMKPWRFSRYKSATDAYNHGRIANLKISGLSLDTRDYNEASQFINSLGYDLLVTGADVCLKPMTESNVEGAVPMYWLSPAIRAKKVMLSSSADVTHISDLSAPMRETMERSIQSYSYIGVRDSMTHKLVAQLGAEESKLCRMADPAFSLSPTENWQLAAVKLFPKRRKGRKLAALHLPNTCEVEIVTQTLDKLGYDLVSITSELPGTKWGGSLTPEGWAGMSNQVDLVVTVSFHESIFAIKQGNPVLVIDAKRNRFHSETGMSKTRCLMRDLGLEASNYLNPFMENFDSAIIEAKVEASMAQDYSLAKLHADQMGEDYVASLRKLTAAL